MHLLLPPSSHSYKQKKLHQTKNSPSKQALHIMDLSNLHAISVLGRGAKGVVFLVCHEPTNETFALKAIPKTRIQEKNTNKEEEPYRRIWLERDILSSLHHPLLPSLKSFFSTDKIVCFVIDWCSGGNLTDLRRHQTEQMFSEDFIRFYSAELVLALEYLHRQGIVYRDLKPENVLIQESGHIMLVDFDLSVKLPLSSPKPLSGAAPDPTTKRKKKQRSRLVSCVSFKSGGVSPETVSDPGPNAVDVMSGKSNSFVGTEEYVAPEIIKGNGHDHGVDRWSLGVVMYEMLYGRTPFRGQNRKETFYRIVSKEPELVGEKTALRDLIGRLLEKDAKKRIGWEEIKRHEFFRGVDWEGILTVERTPFIPGGLEWEEMEGSLGIVDVEMKVEEVFGLVVVEEGGDKSGHFEEF